MVLHGARIGMPLAAVTSFHGSLGSFHDPAPGGVKAKVLVCHGADDALVPESDIEALNKQMKDCGADYEFIAYPGAKHGFTNPEATGKAEKFGMPLGYDADADARSWADMKSLLSKVFA